VKINQVLRAANYQISALPSEPDDIFSFDGNVKQISLTHDDQSINKTVICKCIFDVNTEEVYDIMVICSNDGNINVWRWVNKSIERRYCKAYKNAGLSIDSYGDIIYDMINNENDIIEIINSNFKVNFVSKSEDASIIESIEIFDALETTE